MIYEDRYGNILLGEDIDQMEIDELERRGIHIYAEI
tara:strand:- start:920 stop:1027 length:108 start_codon:yes stop_codon:yes gene_type:complete